MSAIRVSAVTWILFLLLSGAVSTWATWELDGTPVCTEGSRQEPPVTVPSGSGAIIAWLDTRSGDGEVFAQRIDHLGNTLWAPEGIRVGGRDAMDAVVVEDGRSGAILCWAEENPDFTSDIYAQRVDSLGVVLWDSAGVPISEAIGSQWRVQAGSDGASGAIIVWQDTRGGSQTDIYAQRVDSAGQTLWTANGVPVDADTLNQWFPQVVSDGVGGAVIAWVDERSGCIDLHAYAQRINGGGNRMWPSEGVLLSSQRLNGEIPEVVPCAGGAIVTFATDGFESVLAQKISASGTILWGVDGVEVCAEAGDQYPLGIVPSGSGGALIAWSYTPLGEDADIYAQRVDSLGNFLWASGGIAICTAPNTQPCVGFALSSDGADGAILVWGDCRTFSLDIYGQRVDANGSVLWAADGDELCIAVGVQDSPASICDGAGGVITAWQDCRSGGYDIYALRVGPNGYSGPPAEPQIRRVGDVPEDQGGWVSVDVTASKYDRAIVGKTPTTGYNVWRRVGDLLPGRKSAEEGAASAGRGSALRADWSKGAAAGLFLSEAETTLLGLPPGRWESLGFHAATQESVYSFIAPTMDDSSAQGTPLVVYAVTAHTATPSVFFTSAPDSGYSVDNIAPQPPSGLALAGANSILWERNREKDLSHYTVYIGKDSTGSLEEADLIGYTIDTTFALPESTSGYYVIVTASDDARNESDPSNVIRNSTGVAGTIPRNYYLAENLPNPFNPLTTIRYGIPKDGRVVLSVYDITGRKVALLADGEHKAGEFVKVWDGRDEKGREAPSGIYFARLESGEFTATRKMMLMR